jgi:predicted CxxxxCH...CXXCH cytochrome family protein
MNGTVDVNGLNCTSCHGTAGRATTTLNPQLAAAPPVGTKGETATTTRAVGAHLAHLQNTRLRSAAIACTECHAVPTSTSHATGTVDMTWGTLARTGNFVPTWNGSTCTNYCHGSSLGAGGTITAPSWTSGSTQDACGTCHGVPPPAPHSTSTACGTCHAGYTSTSVNLATHINGVVDVTSNHPAGWATKAQHGYQVNLTGLAGCKSCHGTDLAGGTSGVSCATCHATSGFAGWDTNCTFCHGNRTTGRQSPPVDIQGRTVTTNTSVGRHDSHVASTMMAAITCAACHPARSTSVISDTAHVDGNGIAEVALRSYAYTSGASTTTVTGTYTRTSATAATCTVYCHSNFSTTSGGPRTSTSKSWVATTTASCTSCHSTKSSRHTSPSAHSSTACSTCHGAGYTSSSVTGAAVATHVDGKKNIVTTATGTGVRTWNATTRTCTASCHGSKTW